MQAIIQSDVVWRLIIASLLGAIFGLERSLAGKHAGMRTYALVSLGSALFVIVGALSAYDFSMFKGLNPMQIASSIVVGIGFIGAGLSALKVGQGGQPELTTATGIWVSAGIGMAVGFGYYSVATAATMLGLLIFWFLAKVEHVFRVRFSNQSTNS